MLTNVSANKRIDGYRIDCKEHEPHLDAAANGRRETGHVCVGNVRVDEVWQRAMGDGAHSQQLLVRHRLRGVKEDAT